MPTMTNTPPPVSDPAPADQDWFGGRRWTGIAAIGVFVLMVGALGLVLFSPRHSSSTPKSTAPTAVVAPPVPPVTGGATTPTTGTTAAPVSTSTVAVAPLPTAVPTEAPAGTSWTIYNTVALPSIAGVGPTHVDGAIATGYAHTPVGALLAVANESYRYVLADDTTWRAAAAAMLAPGPGFNAWLTVRASHPYGPGGAAGNDHLAQIAAFQFVSYSPSDAAIQLVTETSDGIYQVVPMHVVWDGTDWRFVPGPDGGQGANVQTVPSIDGFIEWRGV